MKEHFYEPIPGWFDYAAFYGERVDPLPDGGHAVELGAWYGRSTAFLAVELVNSGKAFRLDVIDHWKGSVRQDELTTHALKNDVHGTFLGNMDRGGVLDRMTVHKMTSLEGATLFADGSLDFVFIDASHDFASVRADIAAWWPKVKVGGVLSGHDFDTKTDPEVVQAVTTSFSPKALKIMNRTWSVVKEAPAIQLPQIYLARPQYSDQVSDDSAFAAL